MREFIQMCTILPEIKNDTFAIEHFKFSSRDIAKEQLYQLLGHNNYAFHLKENYTYTKLTENGMIWMSDTPLETITNQKFLNNATGNVLIFGLGMGMCIAPLLHDPEIESITIVEKNQDLINFIRKYYKSDKLKIIHGNAFEIDLGNLKFETIYFDIWPSICITNLTDMKILHKKFRKNYNIKAPKRYINSWMKSTLQKMKKEKEKFGYYD